MDFQFRFGEQPSADILAFGGQQLYRHGVEMYHFWDDEVEDVHAILEDMADMMFVDAWTSQFDKSPRGTEDMIYAFEEWEEPIENRDLFLTGLVIWHQLLYSPRLYVEYT